jgi:hypothetical protein
MYSLKNYLDYPRTEKSKFPSIPSQKCLPIAQPPYKMAPTELKELKI